MAKDLTLALNAGAQVQARLPLGSHAHQLYGLLIARLGIKTSSYL